MLKIIFISLILFIRVFPQQDYTIAIDYKIKYLPYGLTKKIPNCKPVVAFALSGGGARGLSQIGVIRALEEAGVSADIIVGTSMGSIVGGLYCSGYTVDQLDSITKATDWNNILAAERQTNRTDLFIDQKITEDRAVFSLRLKGLTPIIPTAINNGQKLSNFLNLLTLQAPVHTRSEFNELMCDYRAVCTDLVTGNPVVISSGSLSQAMRASSSVSFFLSPVRIDTMVLVDGGLVANIPVGIAKSMGSNYIIAVNTTSSLHKLEELNLPWTIADQVVSIPMQLLNQAQLDDASIVISPDVKAKASTDFTNIDSLLDIGYHSAKSVMQKIKADIDSLLQVNLKKEEFYIKNIKFNNTASGIERDLLKKYSEKDSVSTYEIRKDLYELFVSGDYDNIKAVVSPDKNYTSLRILYTEPAEIKQVNIKGISYPGIDTDNQIINSLIGTKYNGERILQHLIKLINLYRVAGLSLAEISEIYFNNETGILHLTIDEGIIHQIVVVGNVYTNPTIITREFPLSEGDYFRAREVEQGLINLRSTNLFDDLVLTVKKVNNENIIVLSVIERISSLIRFGFRVDDEDKFQASLDIRDENVLGTGTEFGVLFSGGTRNRAYILEHKSNRIFNTYFTYKINGFYSFDDIYSYREEFISQNRFKREKFGEYRQIAYGGSLSLGTQMERFGNVILEGKYQINELKNKWEKPVTPYKLNIVSFKLSSTIDTRDDYPYPEKGFYFHGAYETGQQIFGGDVGFTSLGFNYKIHFTFDDIHTFSPRISMGFGDKTLPLIQQYSLGGQNSFYGLSLDEFRGRQLFLSSLEYRYMLPFRIFFDTYFKFRYDLGSTWEVQEQIRFKDLRHGIGSALSFDTPVGPADFSVGRSFLIRRTGNYLVWGDVAFYFSIGYYY
jgi:NTE family protein